MKRKLFSVLFAACAAVVSVSGLTGCGGGGDDEQVRLGAMTLEEFAGGQYHFEFDQGTRGYAGLMERDAEGDEEESTKLHPNTLGYVSGTGWFIADAGNSRQSARMTYMKLGGEDAEGNDLTGMYQLNISFDNVDAIMDEGILSALGIGDDGGTAISSELSIVFNGSRFQAFCNVVTNLENGGEGDGGEGGGGEAGDGDDISGVGTILTKKGNVAEWASR